MQFETMTWISKQAIESIRAEADRCYPLETGGVLVGYVADNAEFVILYVFGPGPNASHRRRRFLPDHEWQCNQLNRLFEESNGRCVYLGDWHTHPDATARMSWLDHRTLRAIAKHPEARLASPLMLIGGGAPEAWNWLCHQYKSDRFLGLLTTVANSDLHVSSQDG